MPHESFERLIRERFDEGAQLLREFGRQHHRTGEAAAALAECLRKGNKVLIFGNGGSAADAQHFAAELVGRFGKERRPLPALALTTDTSALTAIGNDYGFDAIFARQVRALARADDLAIAISTSGQSRNVIRGARAARTAGASTIALTGGDGGELSAVVDIALVVPSAKAARVQEVHVVVMHILCELVESTLFSASEFSTDVPEGAVEWSTLLQLRNGWKREAQTMVWTNGCFDVLHAGHLHLLEHAKNLGDILVVGVNTDDSVRALKGGGRPIVPLAERIRILEGLKATDFVVAFEGLTPEAALADLMPDVVVKSAEYAPPSGRRMPESSVIESYGGRIEFIPVLPEHSTSDMVQRIRRGSGGGG